MVLCKPKKKKRKTSKLDFCNFLILYIVVYIYIWTVGILKFKFSRFFYIHCGCTYIRNMHTSKPKNTVPTTVLVFEKSSRAVTLFPITWAVFAVKRTVSVVIFSISRQFPRSLGVRCTDLQLRTGRQTHGNFASTFPEKDRRSAALRLFIRFKYFHNTNII